MDPASLAWAQQAVRSSAHVRLSFHAKARERTARGDRDASGAAQFSAPARLSALNGEEVPAEFRTEVRQLWRAAVSLSPGESVGRNMSATASGRTYEILAVAEAEGKLAVHVILAEVAS